MLCIVIINATVARAKIAKGIFRNYCTVGTNFTKTTKVTKMIKYQKVRPGALLTRLRKEIVGSRWTGVYVREQIEVLGVIKHPVHNKNKMPCIYFINKKGCIGEAYLNDKIMPIQLTREWIKDFGFVHFANDAYHRPEMLTWRLWYDDTEKAAFYTTDVYPQLGHPVYLPHRLDYVHELQSLFYEMTEIMLNKTQDNGAV